MPLRVALAALVAVVLWGASPVASKLAVAELSPLAVTLLRTVLGGLAAWPVALALAIPLPRGNRERRLLLLSAACGFVLFPLLFSYGIALTSANHASLILAGLPILTGGIAMAVDGKWPRPLWWLGSAVALAGEVLLVSVRTGAAQAAGSLAGDGLVAAACLFASSGYVAGGRLQRAGYPSTGTTFWGVVAATLPLLPVLLWQLPDMLAAGAGPAAWLGVLYLALGVTIAGYVLWYWALGQGSMEKVALLQFLQPVSGVLLAAVLLAEPLTLPVLASAALVLSGVWLAMRGK